MVTIVADSMDLSRGSLRFGCVVKGPKGSWIRFATLEIPVSTMSWDLLRRLMVAWEEANSATPEDLTLPYSD